MTEQGIVIINKPKKGDILVFDGKGYKHISLENVLLDINKDISELKKDLAEARKTIENQELEIKILKGED